MRVQTYMQCTPVLFGMGSIQMLGEKAKELGCKKAMLVYDAGVKAAGISKKAEDSLNAAGVDFIAYDKVLADPPDSMLDEAGMVGKEAAIDCVIGIGGGSSMDSAKAVSILQKHPAPICRYLNLEGPPFTIDGGVPVILVPTSAGTGSEVTRMCIVSYVGKNLKLPIFTQSTLAIVDPELCRTAPTSVTANGGLDALAHAAEAITASNRNPYSEVLAVAAIERIARYLPTACREGGNMEARGELSLAANWAGIAFSCTDVHIGHAAADSVAANYHTPHGLNCAWVTPAVLELVAKAVPEKVRLVGAAMGVEFHGDESSAEIGRKTAEACRALMKSVGIKSMEASGFDRGEIVGKGAPYTADSALRFNCPIEINVAEATWILSSAYDDYQ